MNIDQQAVRKFLFELRNRDLQISDDDSLVAAGILDSLAMVQLLTFIESELNVTIADDDLAPENFESINAIISFVKRKFG